VRIAMWSGPRNISTALMRSWGSRPDTYVCDEPLYAFYLLTTGRDHPDRAEILREHDTDPGSVIAWLTGEIPEGKRIFYQKQMAHHLTPDLDRGWLDPQRIHIQPRRNRSDSPSFPLLHPGSSPVRPTISECGAATGSSGRLAL